MGARLLNVTVLLGRANGVFENAKVRIGPRVQLHLKYPDFDAAGGLMADWA